MDFLLAIWLKVTLKESKCSFLNQWRFDINFYKMLLPCFYLISSHLQIHVQYKWPLPLNSSLTFTLCIHLRDFSNPMREEIVAVILYFFGLSTYPIFWGTTKKMAIVIAFTKIRANWKIKVNNENYLQFQRYTQWILGLISLIFLVPLYMLPIYHIELELFLCLPLLQSP